MTAIFSARSTMPALQPLVTIIVTPQERFSYTQKSLESIYQYTRVPFDLVYIDAGSPKHIRNYLVQAAEQQGFTLLRTEQFLSPNQARNIGLAQAKTDYVVFIDNDVHVSPGWLKNLLHCAKETNAAAISPLSCVGKPLHDRIHFAGGEARIFMDIKDDQIRRRIYTSRFLNQCSAATVKHQLCRRSCEFTELRCTLIKRDLFTQIGPLDEKLLGSQEDIDFSLCVNQAGGLMFCEPTSIVTHIPPNSCSWTDITYFMLRWSDMWEIESLMHFQQKWDLDVDQYFLERYKQIGHRRRETLIYPLLDQLTGNIHIRWIEKLVISIEKWFSHLLTERFAQLNRKSTIKLTSDTSLTNPTVSHSKTTQHSRLQSYNAPA